MPRSRPVNQVIRRQRLPFGRDEKPAKTYDDWSGQARRTIAAISRRTAEGEATPWLPEASVTPSSATGCPRSSRTSTRTRRGSGRARYLMLRLLERAREQQVGVPGLRSTDYINTIPPEREPWFPGDEYVERRIRAYIRWNAAVMVSRANRPGMGVGGHIATYASAASLYEVG